MALKKPSHFFEDKNKKQGVVVPEEQKLPESFAAYKNNVNNVEVLNEFIHNFGSFSENISKIKVLEQGILELKNEIKSSLTQEDLDNAMVSNLLVLEENLEKITESVQAINSQDLSQVYEEVEDISNQVSSVLEELPKYKNLIKSQEVSFDNRLQSYQGTINEQLDGFEHKITEISYAQQEEFEVIKETLQGINEEALQEISVSLQEIQTEVPKYKNTVNKKINEFDERLRSHQSILNEDLETHKNEIEEQLQTIQSSFQELIEQEVPKYQSLLTEAKIENDKTIQEVSKTLKEQIQSLIENTKQLNQDLEEKSSLIEQSFSSKIDTLENHILSSKTTLDETNDTYKKLYHAIEAKGLSDRNQFEEHEVLISNTAQQIEQLLEKIEETKQDILQENYVKEELLDELKQQFSKKFNLIENDIQYQNQKIVKENETLTENVFELKEKIQSIPFNEITEQYHHITKKISFLEEVFDKFDENKILTEGLNNFSNPSENNQDPLTPTNQKFVTLDQLQEHYRLFINRVQQQLATFGGGGETRLEFLDDVDRNSAKTDGYVLSYNAASGKFIGTSVSGGGAVSTQWETVTSGIVTTSNVGIGTTVATDTLTVIGDATITGNLNITGDLTYDEVNARNWNITGIATANRLIVGSGTTFPEDFVVEGNSRIVGILTIGTSSIVLDGEENQVNVGSGVTLHHTNGVQVGGNTVHSTGLRINQVDVGLTTSTRLIVGAGTTFPEDLVVEGNTRITGILTVGTSSIVIDGEENQVNVGTGVTLHHTNGVQVGGNTLHFSGLTLNQINVSGIVTASSFSLPDGLISSGSLTTSSPTEIAIDSFSASSYRSAKYQVQVESGSDYQTTEISVLHNDVTTFMTEYGTLQTGDSLASFTTDLSDGSVRLLATSLTAGEVKYKVLRNAIRV